MMPTAVQRYRRSVIATRRTLPASRRPVYTRETLMQDWAELFEPMRLKAMRFMWHGSDPDTFYEAFDPMRSYPANWWYEQLGRDMYLGRAVVANSVLRWHFCDQFSFSIPSSEALSKIAAFVGDVPLIEYMAGRGYWSYLLGRERGVAVMATDRNIRMVSGGFACSAGGTFIPVRTADVARAIVPRGAAAMLSWIPCESDVADRLLSRMRSGQKLVLIGEPAGGCCAASTTFQLLDSRFRQEATFGFPRFMGLHDRGWFYVRR